MPTQINRRNTLYGYPNPQAGLQQEPIIMNRAPSAADNAEIGTLWINSSTNDWYALTSTGAAGSNWQSSGSAAGNIVATSLTVNPGNITASTGNLSIHGTSTLSGNTTVGGTLGVTGVASFSSIVALPAGLQIRTGAGDPNGVVTAPIGSIYLNTTGSTTTNRMFINTDAGTTWTYFTANA